MRAGSLFRLALVGLAGVLTLPLIVSVLALRGPASGAGAADDGPSVIATVAVGSRPYGVAVNTNTNRIYVTNYDSGNVSVIDGATNTVVATVAVGSHPLGVAVNPNANRIYVANYASDNVSVIDGAGNTVVTTVAVGSYPRAVAVNPNTNRIYVTNSNSNSVSVIDGAGNTVVATVAVGSGPYGVAVNPQTNRIYVTNIYSNDVSVIDGAGSTVVATVAVGDTAYGVAVNPNTNRIYVTNYDSGNVSIIDGAGNTVVATVAVGSLPYGVAVNPDTNRINVANFGDDTVSVIQDYPLTSVFSPAADTYVDASTPTANYGTSAKLRVDASPIVGSYLRFNVTGLSGTVSKATLRVYANSASTVGYRVQGVTDNSWGETTITYSNAPAISPTVVGSSGSFSAGVWTTVDVTSLITGNGTFSMALTGTSATAISLASRESGAQAPQLVIEWSSSSATPTPTQTAPPSATFTPTPTPTTTPGSVFSPVADAYVDASTPTANYGTSTKLRVDASPIVRSYLRFNVTGLSGTVSKATLRVYANSASSGGYRVQGVTNNSWGETTITYNNAPAISPTVVGSSGSFSAGVWTTVDVTSLITGNGTFSMALTGTSATAISLASRESGALAPQLVIEWSSPTQTATPTHTATPTATFTPTPTPTATPGASVFSPVADAYVDASTPTANYGTSAKLRVDASPIVRSYLRFNVTGLSGTVSKATLRVYANSASTVGYRVQGVTDNSWGETTITYNNAPAISPTVVGSSGSFSAGVWTTVDVTSLIGGNGTFSMAVTGTSATAISFASRESGAQAPQLVIE